jgi:hypothetical protein
MFNDPTLAGSLNAFDFHAMADRAEALKMAEINKSNTKTGTGTTNIEGSMYGFKIKNGQIVGTTDMTEGEQTRMVGDFLNQMDGQFSEDALKKAFSTYGLNIYFGEYANKNSSTSANEILATFNAWRKEQAIAAFSPVTTTSETTYKVGDIIDGEDGNQYRVIKLNPDGDPDVELVVSSNTDETSTQGTPVSNVFGTGPFATVPITTRLQYYQDQNTAWGLPKNTGVRESLYNNGYPIKEIDSLLSPIQTSFSNLLNSKLNPLNWF